MIFCPFPRTGLCTSLLHRQLKPSFDRFNSMTGSSLSLVFCNKKCRLMIFCPFPRTGLCTSLLHQQLKPTFYRFKQVWQCSSLSLVFCNKKCRFYDFLPLPSYRAVHIPVTSAVETVFWSFQQYDSSSLSAVFFTKKCLFMGIFPCPPNGLCTSLYISSWNHLLIVSNRMTVRL